MSIFVFFTADDNLLISRLIQRVTSSRWSHAGIGFIFSDDTREYYECLLHHGFTGPHPVPNIISWAAADPRRRVSRIEIKGLNPAVIQRKFETAQAWVGHIGYNAWQILLLWYWQRIGRYLGFDVPESPRGMICSEAVARILYPDVPVCQSNDFDEVTPASLWEHLVQRDLMLSSNQSFESALKRSFASKAKLPSLGGVPEGRGGL